MTRVPYSESETVLPEKITPDTVLPDEIEPIDMPVFVFSQSRMILNWHALTVTSRASIVLEDDVGA